ncbi:MAG: response regulator [Bacteroidota bacterium]|jgi:CheY-like chemotaxis protein|nr:response regulator [Bacteroidota bacterium]
MGTTLTILLAEDDIDDQYLIQEAFKKVDASIKFRVVPNGREAIKYLSAVSDTELPCLIVLDYNMPEANGVEVLQNISGKERFLHIPKVVFSTSSSINNISECLSKGADAYIIKPPLFNDLIKVARQMLEMCGKAA